MHHANGVSTAAVYRGIAKAKRHAVARRSTACNLQAAVDAAAAAGVGVGIRGKKVAGFDAVGDTEGPRRGRGWGTDDNKRCTGYGGRVATGIGVAAGVGMAAM